MKHNKIIVAVIIAVMSSIAIIVTLTDSLINKEDIPSYNTNIALTKDSCGQFYSIPLSQDKSSIPVLMMNPNSIGCASLTYALIYGNTATGPQWPANGIANFDTLSIGKYNQTVTSGGIKTTGQDVKGVFQTVAMPNIVNLTNIPIGTNFTITYILRPFQNATGFYDYSIPKPNCGSYPLVIGYSEKLVNSSGFSKALSGPPPLCASSVYKLTDVKVYGMNYMYIKLQS